MRNRSRVSAALGAAAILLTAAPATDAKPLLPGSANPASYITYTEDVPCPPEGRAAPVVHRRAHRPHRRRLRRVKAVVHHAVKRRPAVVHVRHRVRHHRPHLVGAAHPVHQRRCSVVRHDRLTTAAFGIVPTDPVLEPASYDVEPGGPAIAPASSGRAAFGDGVGGGAGGGADNGGGVIVSDAPEPDTWALLIAGVAGIGVCLRRRRRSGQVGEAAGS